MNAAPPLAAEGATPLARAFDVLVIGSGIAGLSFALKVARQGRSVAILTKKNKADSNTNYAQGGIAVVTAQTDDFAKHVSDTLVAGDGLCDRKVVRQIVADGPARVRELIELGLDFSRDDEGARTISFVWRLGTLLLAPKQKMAAARRAASSRSPETYTTVSLRFRDDGPMNPPGAGDCRTATRYVPLCACG